MQIDASQVEDLTCGVFTLNAEGQIVTDPETSAWLTSRGT